MSASTASSGAERTGRLVLSDGRQYEGRVFGACRTCSGEVVFNTGMVGYPESITDPSYRAQILVTTYPLVGNYGVPARRPDAWRESRFESDRPQVAGIVVSTLSEDYSHWQAASSLHEWLAEEGVIGIERIDTRALTKSLRDGGTIPGKIVVDGEPGGDAGEDDFEDISQRNLVAEVSVTEPRVYGDGKRRVILVDCGVKLNILRSLLARGVQILRVPWDYDFNGDDGDAVIVSNGPGDPRLATAAIDHLRIALEGERPIFGICLGNQLVGLAAGCETYKLPFGHRSQNQPCREAATDRCYVTSQNHGYAIDASSLPDGWEEWFVNANDGSNEGIRHCERPFRTVQFHPEATPGPRDTAFLFDRFVEELE